MKEHPIEYAAEIKDYNGNYLPGYITGETKDEVEAMIRKVYAGTGWSTTPDTVTIYSCEIDCFGRVHEDTIMSCLSSNCYVDITKE